jgi:hypothetical protein
MFRNCCPRGCEDKLLHRGRRRATPRGTRESALRDDRDCSCRPLLVVTRQRSSRPSGNGTHRHSNRNRVVALVLLLRSDHESTRALRVMRRDRYPRLSLKGRIMDWRRRRSTVSERRRSQGESADESKCETAQHHLDGDRGRSAVRVGAVPPQKNPLARRGGQGEPEGWLSIRTD